MAASTVYAPLTTIFSLPPARSSDCFSNIYQEGLTAAVLGKGLSCIPPGPTPVSLTLSAYYSPGVYNHVAACPDNFTPACSTILTSGTITETAVTCCPRPNGLKQFSRIDFSCQPTLSALIAAPWFAQYGCTMQLGNLAREIPLTVTNSDGLIKIVTLQPTMGVNAYSVQVRFQASDLSLSTTPTTLSTISATSSSVVVTSSAQSPASSNSLSMDTKVALAVIIPVVVIAALIVGALVLRRRHKVVTEQEYGEGHSSRGFEYGCKVPPVEYRGEEIPVARSELDSTNNSRFRELPASNK